MLTNNAVTNGKPERKGSATLQNPLIPKAEMLSVSSLFTSVFIHCIPATRQALTRHQMRAKVPPLEELTL